jgi:hypothetical protein
MIGGRRRNLRARLILGTATLMLAVENRHAGLVASAGGAARSRHALQATPGDRAGRFHGDRSQPAAGRA